MVAGVHIKVRIDLLESKNSIIVISIAHTTLNFTGVSSTTARIGVERIDKSTQTSVVGFLHAMWPRELARWRRSRGVALARKTQGPASKTLSQ